MKKYIQKFYDRILSLFKYNYKEIIKDFFPKGNRSEIKDSEIKEIKEGLILAIISLVLLNVFTVVLNLIMYYKLHSAFGNFESIFHIAFKDIFILNIYTIILNIIFSIAIPVITLIYIEKYKNVKQTSWPYYILTCLSLVIILSTIVQITGYFSTLFSIPFITIICIVINLFIILAFTSIFKGSLDFCYRVSLEETKSVIKSEENK